MMNICDFPLPTSGTQVKINGPVKGSEPVLTVPLRALSNELSTVRYEPVTGPLWHARKNNGPVVGFQAMKCQYI